MVRSLSQLPTLLLLLAPAVDARPQVVEEVRAHLEWVDAPTLEAVLERLGGGPELQPLLPTEVEQASSPGADPATIEGVADFGRALVEARRAGDHARGHEAARGMHDLFAEHLGVDHWQTREAYHYVRLLGDLADSAPGAQELYAEAYRGTLEIPYLARSGVGGVDEALVRALAYQQAVEEVLGAGHPESAASLGSLAALLHARGEFSLARQAALAAWPGQEAHDTLPRLRAMNLNVLATLCTGDGELAAADVFARCSLEARRATSGVRDAGYATSLVNLANVLGLLGDLEQARTLQEEGLALRRDLPGVPGSQLLNSLINLAQIEGELGNGKRSRELLEEAVERSAVLQPGGSRDVAFAHVLLAELARSRGDLLEAEREVRAGLGMLTELFPDGHPDLAFHLQILAGIQLERGDLTAAGRTANEALVAARASAGHPEVSVPGCLELLAEILGEEGRTDRALELTREAFALRGELSPEARPALARTRMILAQRLADHGLVREALAQAQRSREELDAIHGREGAPVRAAAANLTGELHLRLGDAAAAAEAFGQSEGLLRAAAPDHVQRTGALLGLGLAQRRLGRNEEAAQLLDRALARREQRRLRVAGSERERALYAGTLDLSGVARTLALTLLDQGRTEEALIALERGRALPLLDLLAEARLDVEAELTRRAPEHLPAYREARGLLAEARRALAVARHRSERLREREDLGPDSARRIAEAEREEEFARRTVEHRVNELSRLLDDWQLFDELRPPAVTLEDLRQVSWLEPGEQLLEYLWTAERVVCFLLERDPRGGPRLLVHEVATDGGAVDELEDRVRSLSAALEEGGTWQDRAGELARHLLPPAARSADAAWIVVPDGPLVHLPFELLEPSRSISSSLSASLLPELRARSAEGEASDGRVLLLGDPLFAADSLPSARSLPRLPGTAREAGELARLFERAGSASHVLSGEEATLANLEREAGGVRVLHLATHGWPGSSLSPSAAGLALAGGGPDGVLTLERLLSAWRGRLAGCELVTLSACDSGRGTRVGDSHMALSWGLWAAGAEGTLVSRWRIDDLAALLLMRRFYENWLGCHDDSRTVAGQDLPPREPAPAARALAEARTWLANRPASENRRELEGFRQAGLLRGDDVFPLPGAAPRSRATDESFDFSHPRHWAAFVLVGATR